MKKKIFSIWSVLLILVISIAVLVPGCDGADAYRLTVAVSPDGAGTTTPTGTTTHTAGTAVNISAVAAPCYRFVEWTGDNSTIADVNAAATTITMDDNYSITANFELTPPDHYKFYGTSEGAPYVDEVVQLEDQFGTFSATVGYALSFGNPVQKIYDGTTPIADENRHYTLYELDYGEEEPMLDSWQVMVNNQFQDDAELTVWGPVALAVPTQKGDHEAPGCLDHFLVYEVMPSSWLELEDPIAVVDLHDQFQDQPAAEVGYPVYFANPVHKTVPGGAPTPIEHEDEHMVFYYIDGAPFEKEVQIVNQFGEQTLDLIFRDTLAVPSEKISVEQPLDHFHCYWAGGDAPSPPAIVELEDQFIEDWLGEPLIALVGEPVYFANPADKWHGEEVTLISNWDDHYTFYELEYEEITPEWHVTVSNQFDPLGPIVDPPVYQELYVSGPDYLAVPTQKGDQDPPVNLDHFLVYTVVGEPPIVGAEISLYDQFTYQGAMVYEPAYFANPVKKTDATGVTDIMHPYDHLVFYWIDGGEFSEESLPIANQFGPQVLGVWQEKEDLLGVPSEKLIYAPIPP